MENIITPTSARKNLFNLIKQVNLDHVPITISSVKKDNDAVLISKRDYEAMLETMYLENQGVGEIVRKREKDNSGFTDIEDIDWEKL